jgi:TPR repeat protein
VVAWTKASVGRRWVIEEAEDGQSRGILIPVFLDGVDPPRGFREVQGARLSSWRGKSDDKEFRRLCGALREVIGEPGEPPPARPKPAVRTGTRLKWIAAAVALALLGGGSWLRYGSSSEPEDLAGTSAQEPAPEPDPLIAALRYKERCDRGDAEACHRLGGLYNSGRGVGVDPLRAAGLYQRACESGIAEACVSLGTLYQEGRAVAKDEDRAERLYKKVCDGGLEAGCERLELLKNLRLERAKQAERASTETRPVNRPAAKSESKVEQRAKLRVTVLPWGNVWVNGKYGTRAPLNVSLKPGKYTIGVGQGSPTKRREVKLKPGEQKTEHFDLSR